MSKTPAKRPSEDDPWEELAEGLFGIEYGKEHASREDEPAFAPPEEPEPEPAFEEPEAGFEEPDSVEEPEPEPVVSEPEDDEPPAIAAKLTEPAAGETEKDPFWDALADWDVDDPHSVSKSPPPTPVVPETPGERPSYDRGSSGRGGRRDERGPRREGGRREGSRGGSRSEGRRDEGRGGRKPEGDRGAPRREEPSRSAPRSERKPPEPVGETEGFGAGLIEEDPFARSVAPEPADDFDDDFEPIETEAAEKSPAQEAEDESEGSRRPRRRRRRRGRRGEGEAEAPASSKPAPVEADFDEDEEEGEGDDEEPLARTASEEPVEEGRPPRGRGRYGRRRRGERPDESEFVFDFIEDDEPAAAAAVADEDELDDEDSVEAMDYANVPSWEEAISYILNPSLVQVEGGSPPAQQKRGSGDAPKQTRHYGRRKS